MLHLLLLALLAAQYGPAQAAAPISITILHTNDVHSHFRSEKSPLKLGGVARLKTAVQAIRARVPEALLVDGGDWSEGDIYYTEGAGTESLAMMDAIGYDVAVVGNHDWLNGPARLLEAVKQAHPSLSLVGANFLMGSFSSAAEFGAAVLPYVVKKISGVSVAFIGLTNFDPVYAPYLKPVSALNPGPVAVSLATQLKAQGVDVVVGISHNAVEVNRDILTQALDMDLIIGGHDHKKLIHPSVVSRPGRPDAWVVEAGSWGRYLGRVELWFQPRSEDSAGKVELKDYTLTQLDRSISEDPEIVSRIDALEARIEAKRGPIFHDHIADCELELSRDGLERPIVDFVTDSYRRATGADIAVNQNNIVYGELHEGPVTTADLFRADPAVFDLAAGKSWTLHTWKMSGTSIALLFRLMFTWRKMSDAGGLGFSGLEITYDPTAQKENLEFRDVFPGFFGLIGTPVAVHELTLGGHAIDGKTQYKLVANNGIVEALKVLNDKYFNIIPLGELVDTGIEDWKALVDYAHEISPVTTAKLGFGGRIRTWQPDLGILFNGFRWTPLLELPNSSVLARVEVVVQNFGGQASADHDTTITLESSEWGYNLAKDPIWQERGAPQVIASLAPGESRTIVWDEVEVPEDRGLFPLTATLHSPEGLETNSSNDTITQFF